MALIRSAAVTTVFGPFYTGGKIYLGNDESFAICCCGPSIHKVDLASGQSVASMTLEEGDVFSCALSPDNESVVSTNESLIVTVWDLEGCSPRRRWKTTSPVVDFAWDPTSSLVAGASGDSTVAVWDAAGGFQTHIFRGHTSLVTCVTFHPNPERLHLYSGDRDGNIFCWDLKTKKCISQLKNHGAAVTRLCFTPCGSYLLSGGRDSFVTTWEIGDSDDDEHHRLLSTTVIYDPVEALSIIPRSTSSRKKLNIGDLAFAVGGENGLVKVWKGGKSIWEQQPESKAKRYPIMDICIGKRSGRMVVTTGDHHILLFSNGKKQKTKEDLEEEKKKKKKGIKIDEDQDAFNPQVLKHLIGYSDEITDVGMVDSQHLVVATNSDKFRVINAKSRDTAVLAGHTDIILSMDISSLHKIIATASKDNTVRIWYCPALHADNSKIDTSSSNNDVLLPLPSFVCVAILAGHVDSVGAVSVSHKTPIFAVSGSNDKTVKVWSLSEILHKVAKTKAGEKFEIQRPSAKFTVKAHDKDINAIAVAPNDSLFATASEDKLLKIWRSSDNSLLGICRGHRRGIWSCAFSPVDKVIASSSGDSTIKLFSLASYSCLRTFEGHSAAVLRVSFVKHGMQLISSSADGLVKFWLIKTGECVGSVEKHEDKIWALSVMEDGEKFATGGADAQIILWENKTAEEEQKALAEAAKKFESEQKIQNSLRNGKYVDAVLLAFELDKPLQMLGIFQTILSTFGDNSEDEITKIVSALNLTNVGKMLKLVRDWNSTAKNSAVAQAILAVIFKVVPQKNLLKIGGIKQTIAALLPYTERHFIRVDTLLQKSFLIDFTLQSMQVLLPTDEAALLNAEQEEEGGEDENMNGVEEEEEEVDLAAQGKWDEDGEEEQEQEEAQDEDEEEEEEEEVVVADKKKKQQKKEKKRKSVEAADDVPKKKNSNKKKDKDAATPKKKKAAKQDSNSNVELQTSAKKRRK